MSSRTDNFAESLNMLREAGRVIPGASQTFSKGADQFVKGASPLFLERGQGCQVWDVDGNRYMDMISGLLAVVLGYAHPAVNQAVAEQLARGVSFSLPSPMELRLARRLVELIPCAEMVRFGKNGSDATAGAVRAARAHTGRDMVACCGYHGWQDWYIGSTVRCGGVPQATRDLVAAFAYNDLGSLEKVFAQHPGQVACVIMEPVNFVPPAPGFLEGVRQMAHDHGALLIFDEIITGFRFGLGGAQERFGVTPDLACFGKSLGNGLPISVVAGRAEVMKVFEEVFFSFTFGGEALALAAALAVLDVMEHEAVIEGLWARGRALQDGVRDLLAKHGLARWVSCDGYPAWSRLRFLDTDGQPWLALQSLFQQEAAARGVLIQATHNLNHSHGEAEIDHLLAVYDEVFGVLAPAAAQGDPQALLRGEPIRPVFRVR